MAGNGSHTLKLSVLADVSELTKGLNKASKQTDTFAHKLTGFGKKAGIAMAAAGAAAAVFAVKLGVDSVKAAIEDDKAARKLAQTLQNVTHATKKQTDAVEKYITKTTLRTGIEDDQLRPALARLIRSTEDAAKAQDLLNLALDISAGTGKSLDTVANALGKAYDGNAASLGRLGLGLDSHLLKSKNVGKIMDALRRKFRGFADNEANTFEGKLRRLNVAFKEAKETVGGYLLDGLTPLVNYAVKNVIPAMSNAAEKIGGLFGKLMSGDKKGAFKDVSSIGKQIGKWLGKVGDFIREKAPIVAEKLKVLVSAIGEKLVASAPAIGERLVEMLVRAGNAISAAVPKLLKWASDMVEKLSTYLSDHGGEIVGAVVGWILKSLPDLLINLGKLLDTITTWIYTSAIPALLKLLVSVGKSLLTGIWSGLQAAWPTMTSKFGEVGKSLANALTAPFRGAFNLIAKLWNETVGSWSWDIPSWVPKIGGNSFGMPKMPTIPELAKGGVVNRPTLAMIGEAGPEAVVPLRGRGGLGTTVNVYVEGSVVAERDLVLKLRNEIGQLMRRQSVGTAAFGI